MPSLRELLKKKDKIDQDDTPAKQNIRATEFTFMRSDTHTEEYIKPPGFDDDSPSFADPPRTPSTSRLSFSRFNRSPSPAVSASSSPEADRKKDQRRLSHRLHLNRDRSASSSSVNLPDNLPSIDDAYTASGDRQDKEAKWEHRATVLASKSPVIRSQSPSPQVTNLGTADPASPRPRSVNDPSSDIDIQEAIRLHESGDLAQATQMFRQLAQSGNVLSQVLYGLSLRHGWGCDPDLKEAVVYLSAAASNSATIEADALKAGMKKGGAAKGELVLAIFELANCFRYGWGIAVDKPAARQYYETAANLGDTDAMNEAAWCYLEGFGGKKDKFKAAQLLRLAETSGAKTLGNTWIWKEKYDPPK
ncbi:hypothetical protein PV10_08027 [Exophiala mesophila]|uniref:HCP-like protein n=1 Tax=Exophiala mesophila TaxID=212818 RepID=A0A0D1WHN7_EXOME|nr:uncharacterized protein PV10_08027 [Exophiala mesophila]KIV88335.1 hypothetical protein PV10_08027 [Exophiala mesophila]